MNAAMVELTAFRALRFSDRHGPLAPRLAPPYDVISPALQRTLFERDPHNIVRVDFPPEAPGDDPDARYRRAAATLESWLAEGAMVRDPRPAVTVLAQTFVGPDGVRRTRTGFFAKVRLARFDEGQIMPHERTLRGPKEDRLRLFRATKANLSPIFTTYRDPDGRVLAALDEIGRRPPTATAELDGVENRIWIEDDPARLAALSEHFRTRRLYIADGHHRYETGLAYRDERRAAAGALDPDAGYEHILAFSAAAEDPGMLIFPTHRVVRGLPRFDLARTLTSLGALFTVTELPATLEAAERLRAAHRPGENAFLLLASGRAFLLVASDRAKLRAAPTLPVEPELCDLDVSVLHAAVLEHVLGITREAQTNQTHLDYVKDTREAFARAGEPGVDAVFVMNPTRIEEVLAVADAGHVMPQKSTFFYPKIPSGLVLYPFEP